MKSIKLLTRSEENAKLAGICGAFADYFDINSRLVRIIWSILTVVTFFIPGIIFYLFLMLLIPRTEK